MNFLAQRKISKPEPPPTPAERVDAILEAMPKPVELIEIETSLAAAHESLAELRRELGRRHFEINKNPDAYSAGVREMQAIVERIETTKSAIAEAKLKRDALREPYDREVAAALLPILEDEARETLNDMIRLEARLQFFREVAVRHPASLRSVPLDMIGTLPWRHFCQRLVDPGAIPT